MSPSWHPQGWRHFATPLIWNVSAHPSHPFAQYAYCTYTLRVAAQFDPEKNAENLRKHGVPPSEGDGVLSDPLALTVEDPSAEGEQRFVTIGTNVFGLVMVGVWTPRGDDPRTISVRRAEPRERRDYEEGI